MNTTVLTQHKPKAIAQLSAKTLACLFNKRFLSIFLLITFFAAAGFGKAGNTTPAKNPATVKISFPSLAITGTPLALSTPFGIASASTTFNVSGTGLIAGNLTVTAPTGFDVSADNSTWSGSGGSFTIAETGGTLPATPVYVRLDAADAINSYTGSVSITGGSASAKNEAIPTSTVVNPAISSITAGSAYSSASSITFTVTFSASISGLNASNFSLTASDPTGTSIASVGGSGTTYTVTVNTGSGDGTISLNLANATGILPGISTILPFTGGVTIDKTLPTVTIGSPSVSSIADGVGSVTYTVTYADANFKTSTLALANITPYATGTAGGTLALTKNTSTSYTVTISGIYGAGTLGISIAAGTASDLAGNTAPAATSATFAVVTPTISTTGTLSALITTTGTASSSTSFSVSGVNLTAGNLTVTAPVGFDMSMDNSTWYPTGLNLRIAETGTLAATPVYIRLDATDGAGGYAGNIAISGGDAASVNVAIHSANVLLPATVVSITPTGASPTNATTLNYTVVFTAALTTPPSAGDFILSGAATGTINSVNGSGTTYNVNVTGVSGNGTLELDMTGGSDASPTISNVPFTGGAYTVDQTPPTLTIGSPSVSSIADGAGPVTYTVTYADANFNTSTLALANITLNTTGTAGGTLALTENTSTSYTVTISGITGAGTLGISIAAGTASDLAGNLAPAPGASATFAVVTPTISTTGTPAALTTTSGTASSSTSFHVSGLNLTAGNLTVTAPAGFDVSADNVTWSASGGSFTIAETGTLASTPVYVRLDAADAANTYSGNVVISGGGASSVNEAIPGSAVVVAPTISYSNPSIYTVGSAITPLTPTGGGVAAQAYNSTPVNIGSGISGTVAAVAVDAAGNVYATTSTNLYKIPVTGAAPFSLAAEGANTTGVAVDAAGNIYTGSGNILKEYPVGGTVRSISISVTPASVAVDAAGNIYIGNKDGASVLKIAAGSGTQSVIGVAAATRMFGVAVDAAGNIYADCFENGIGDAVYKIPVVGSQVKIFSNGAAALGLAVDAAGNVYVAPEGNVIELPAGGGAQVTIGSGFTAAGVAVDAAGNLYVASGNVVSKVLPKGGYYTGPFLPAGLTINTTTGVISGTPTAPMAATNYTVTGYNSAGLSTTAIVTLGVAPAAPTTAATGVTFTGTTTTATAAGWTSGNGTSRAVFMAAATSGSPAPANLTAYNANAAFGTGDQIGSTGWYCVYNGTGSTVNITGLTAGTTYQAMVVEYNGTGNLTGYLTTPGTGNPAGVTTLLPSTTVTSITAVSTSPTNATTLNYTVTFAEALNTPPSTADFTLTGTATGTVNSITTTDNINYDVNVTNVSGNGTLELDMTGGSDASPTISNVPFTGGSYTIDQTPPTATITFASNDGNPAVAYPGETVTLNFAVSEQVGNPVVTIAGTTEQATTTDNINYTASYTLQTNDQADVNGNVPYSISLTDLAFNTANYASADAGSAAVALDHYPPDLSGTAPAYLNGLVGTASPSTTFTVSGDNIADNIQVTAPRGYEISADNVTFGSSLTVGAPGTVNATLYIRLRASDTYNAYYGAIALNTTNASEVDLTVSGFVNPPPTTVLSIVPATTGPTNATSVDFLVTLGSQLYNGLNGSDFTLTGTATGTISSVSFNGTAYDVNVTNVSGSGTLGLTFTSADGSTPTITNLPFTGGSYTIDQTAPTLTNTAYYTSNSNISWGKLGDVIHLNMAFSKPVQTPVIIIDGNPVAVQPGGGNSWTASYTLTSSDTEGQIPFDIQVTDLAGNTNEFTSATQGLYVNFDMTPPTVSISTPSVTGIGNGSTSMVTYTITYADANFNTSNLAPAAVSLVTTGSANANIKTIGSGTSYTVTVSNITGTGSLGISLTGGYASDLAGNTDAAVTTTSATFSVLSSDAGLSSLTLSNGTLSPAYNAANPSATYSAAVGNGAKFSITPTADNPTATITVNGKPAPSGQATAVPLVVGPNTITIVVTAAAGNTQTFTLTVTEAQSANDNLASVKTNAGLAQGTTVPTALTESVSNAIGSITVTPTTADPTATVTVNGRQVTSGQPSTNISLGVGSTAITIVVKAQNNITKTYTLTVTRAASSNNTLANLALSTGTLSPAFSTGTSYTASVANGATLTVTPTVADPTATLTINATTAPSGKPTAVTITPGTNTITIVVTAQDKSTLTYTVVVTEAKSSNDNLAGLTLSNGTLSPAFGAAVISYTASVGNGATLSVTPTVADPTATLTINGTTAPSGAATAVTIAPGANIITIVVTAADNSAKTYTVVVTEAKSANDRLLSFKTSAGLAQGQTVPTTLTESVANSVSTIMVTPTTLDATATVTVNNTTVTSGSPSTAIALSVGGNTITTVVTAQNGAALTYTLTVTRAASSTLTGLALSSGTLSPVFATGTTAYTGAVASTISSINVTPTATDPNATISINGTTVASGTASTAILLAAGNTTITVVVTAADNSSTTTYTAVVDRARSPDDALFSFKTSAGLAKGKTVPTTLTESVVNAVSSITVTPTVDDPTATVTVNGAGVPSGTASASIPLMVGNTTITVVVTAQNTATQTYTLTVTRAPGSMNTVYQPVGVQNFEPLRMSDDGINVHQGLSPNGDGINDFLQIDNISQYPDNNLKIMNRNGQLVFEAKGYDNANKTFDGHSNKNGQMQLPGTYFYSLDYTIDGVTKHKTGYLVLKY